MNDPIIAIVGRPNVGKSTLFNRIVGSRRAIVGDEPGITRDRLYGNAEWRGRTFRVVDTGGIIPEEKDFIPSEIFRQAKVALDEASAVVMVVDGRSELAGPDLELARLLMRTGKPLFLAVNKADSDKQAHLLTDFHRLGMRNMYAISAEHGRGLDDLLDALLPLFPHVESKTQTAAEDPPEAPEVQPAASVRTKTTSHESGDRAHEDEPTLEEAPPEPEPRETKIAIIGHPNVGKSTLLNQLTGHARSIVSPIPGTTRDAVDEVVEHNGRVF